MVKAVGMAVLEPSKYPHAKSMLCCLQNQPSRYVMLRNPRRHTDAWLFGGGGHRPEHQHAGVYA